MTVQPRAERLAAAPDLAALLGVKPSHPRLGPALDSASAKFRAAVRHPVSRLTSTVVLDGDGTRSLLLPAIPVVQVASVRLAGRADPLTAGVDFQVSSRFGILRRTGGTWPDELDAVTVEFTHGFEPIPDAIAEAVLEHAAAVFRARPGVASLAIGGEATTWAAGVTETWSTAVAEFHLGRRG